jgi:hypothetical protein
VGEKVPKLLLPAGENKNNIRTQSSELEEIGDEAPSNLPISNFILANFRAEVGFATVAFKLKTASLVWNFCVS